MAIRAILINNKHLGVMFGDDPFKGLVANGAGDDEEWVIWKYVRRPRNWAPFYKEEENIVTLPLTNEFLGVKHQGIITKGKWVDVARPMFKAITIGGVPHKCPDGEPAKQLRIRSRYTSSSTTGRKYYWDIDQGRRFRHDTTGREVRLDTRWLVDSDHHLILPVKTIIHNLALQLKEDISIS